MNIQDFKDEVLDVFEKKDLFKRFKNGPIYFLVSDVDDDELLMGQFPSADSIPEFLDMTRMITRSTDFVAVAMMSMTADLNDKSDEEVDAIMKAVDNMGDHDAMDFLKEEGLLEKAVTIRFEARDEDGNSIISCPIGTDGNYFKNVMELNDEDDGAGEASIGNAFDESLFLDED